jgi:cytochrome P450
VRVPRGSLVFANVYGLHREPGAFPDPERFDPERWQGDLEKRLPRGSFLPFIDGPRVCIGNQFALLEGQLVLATFARRVVFEPVHAGAREPEPLVTLRPRGGLPVTVRRL